MALVIDLKPSEKVIIGTAVIRNDQARTRLHIEGDAPILREKDIMTEKEADTPCKKVYLAVQLMYLSPKPEELHEVFFNLVRDIQQAAPSTTAFFAEIGAHISAGQYYKALKETKKLIEYEEGLLKNVG